MSSSSLRLALLLLCCAIHCFGDVGITYVRSAQASGAVCLDGSVPAYHLRRGSGSGRNSWHLHLEGGGWCSSNEDCAQRATTNLGSSRFMQASVPFAGLLSDNSLVNPDFHNWNHVYVRYCDGASFSADVNAPTRLSSGQVLYFRGLRIFKAVMDDLKLQGLNRAREVLLSGTSAGGLASIQRCNDLQRYFPGKKVKCLSDSGFFVNAPDTSGMNSFYVYFNGIAALHNLGATLEKACTSAHNAAECFFPQTMQAYVQPPLFIVNAAFDSWQLDYIVKIPRSSYAPCITSRTCPAMNAMQKLRDSMIAAVTYTGSRASSGVFIDSCFTHNQVQTDDWSKPQVRGKSVAHSVGDWYFGRGETKLVDQGFRNPSCISTT